MSLDDRQGSIFTEPESKLIFLLTCWCYDQGQSARGRQLFDGARDMVGDNVLIWNVVYYCKQSSKYRAEDSVNGLIDRTT